MFRLSIIVPCYNEYSREGFKNHVLQLIHMAEKDNIQLIFVDDGSCDETFFALHDYLFPLQDFEEIVLSRHDHLHESNSKYLTCSYNRNKGKGYAIMTGIKLASGQYIGYLDADLSVEPDQLIYMSNNLVWQNGAIAVRKDFGNRPWYRQLATKVVHTLAVWIFGLSFTDTQCGCKVFPAWTMKMVAERAKCLRWLFDIELLCIMKAHQIGVVEHPVQWGNSNDSRITLQKDFFPTLFELIDLIFRLPSLRA